MIEECIDSSWFIDNKEGMSGIRGNGDSYTNCNGAVCAVVVL